MLCDDLRSVLKLLVEQGQEVQRLIETFPVLIRAGLLESSPSESVKPQ